MMSSIPSIRNHCKIVYNFHQLHTKSSHDRNILLSLVNYFHSTLNVRKIFSNTSTPNCSSHSTYRIFPNINYISSRGCSMNSDSSSSDSDETQPENEKEIENKVLEASLTFVNSHGWTRDAIAKGAESLGYSSALSGMFNQGGVELVNYFYSRCNSELDEKLQHISDQSHRKNQSDSPSEPNERINKNKSSTTAFIRNAVEMRLRMNIPYMSSWSDALALHASPSNWRHALTNNGTLMDTIWYHAGDRSYDFNWYTKRGLLAVVYKSTELCMLQDQSEDYQETWAFLNRRLENVTSFGKCVKSTRDFAKDSTTLFQVGCTTVQNIIGFNSRSKT